MIIVFNIFKEKIFQHILIDIVPEFLLSPKYLKLDVSFAGIIQRFLVSFKSC